MATLKEHQAAMVDLLANGSGIPASASRLAHAMHDLLGVVMLQSAARENAADIRVLFGMDDATTPGLNDKALSKREKALKTDSPAKWPTPAEQRVKELENTILQLRQSNKTLRAEKEEAIRQLSSAMQEITDLENALRVMAIPEQAGCRKDDTQVCDHDWVKQGFDVHSYWECSKCGEEYM